MVFDVAMDLRKDSYTYGKRFGIILSIDNKVTGFYHPDDERGLLWNGPDIGIVWPNVDGESFQDKTKLILSEKDRNWTEIKRFDQQEVYV